MLTRIWSIQHPLRILVLAFVSWKTLLLLIAACSPGPGYDTSTTLSFPVSSQNWSFSESMVTKLTRWDAIYFVKAASRGYLFEQEWAFGWGFTRFIAWCSTILQEVGISQHERSTGLMAIVIAHAMHLLSVLVLFSLTRAIFPKPSSSGFALVTALLHVISPAGIFLSAPYAESSCALLTFLGCLFFVNSQGSKGHTTLAQDLLVFISGMAFGIATTFRSNGILSGLLLLEEAFRVTFSFRHGLSLSKLRRLIATGLGGLGVGCGFLLPQYIAYNDFCTRPDIQPRPWCLRTLPSIYTFVQDHYWNCGLFRYWTFSNLPLFLLATPMISIMVASGIWGLQYQRIETHSMPKRKTDEKDSIQNEADFPILRNLAVSQLLLALLTFTTAHVQIITRLSSAYPVWMWFVSKSLVGGDSSLGKSAIRILIIYGLVQGGLFASFLPPA